MLLALDPGDLTGLALFHDDGRLERRWIADLDHTLEYLEDCTDTISVIVIEDFILFRKRAQSQVGSRFKASQVIGAAKLFARRQKAKVVIQPSGILTIAEQLSGVKKPSDHRKSHDIDAFNHGYYYLVAQHIIKPAAQQGLDTRNHIR
jgi:hypothetical protein